MSYSQKRAQHIRPRQQNNTKTDQGFHCPLHLRCLLVSHKSSKVLRVLKSRFNKIWCFCVFGEPFRLETTPKTGRPPTLLSPWPLLLVRPSPLPDTYLHGIFWMRLFRRTCRDWASFSKGLRLPTSTQS